MLLDVAYTRTQDNRPSITALVQGSALQGSLQVGDMITSVDGCLVSMAEHTNGFFECLRAMVLRPSIAYPVSLRDF